MKPFRLYTLVIPVFVIAISAYYLITLMTVPFHPDESTQIFMSSDVQSFFTDPSSLYYNSSDKQNDKRQQYRLLDAPITRYLIGIGLFLGGEHSHQHVDWNWSLDWQENVESGAHPGNARLLIARLSVAWMYPITLLLVYFAGKKMGNQLTGLAAMVLFAFHSLVLLHTRRAMAEQALLFFICLFVYLIIQYTHTTISVGRMNTHSRSFFVIPIVLAVPAALAICAKQSALTLIFPGILASLMNFGLSIKKRLFSAGLFVLLTLSLIWVLNPIFWTKPITALQAAIQARAELLDRQVQTLSGQDQSVNMDRPGERAAGMILHLYLAPPVVSDVPNYDQALLDSNIHYLSNPVNNLFRGILGGMIMAVLSVFGVVLYLTRIIKEKSPERSRNLVLLVVTGMSLVLGIWISIPIPFQRYYLPLVPFVCLFAAYAISFPFIKREVW